MVDRALFVGCLAVALLCTVFAVSGLGSTALWANVQWTVIFLTAPLLAWRLLPSWAASGPVQRCFLIGLGLYACGQIVYLGQVLLDHNPSPAPSDLLFLALGPAVALGLLRALGTLAEISPSERLAIALDALCVFLAAVTTVLALYLPRIGDMSALDVLFMTAYPAGFFALTGAGAILALAAGSGLGARSPLPLLLGLLGSAVCWVLYNEIAFGDGDLHHPFIALGFSVSTLLLALGSGRWQLRPAASARWRQGCFLTLRLVPLLLVAGAALVIALPTDPQRPLVNAMVQSGALAVIALAVLRQGLVLWERDRLLAAESDLVAARQEGERMEQRLREAERLESIGRLAGGVAHDFNNLLAAILGHSELALRKASQHPQVQDHLQAIHRAGERGAELVQQLLGFARRQFASPRPTDLNDLCAEVDQLLQRTLGEHIDLAVFPAAQPAVAMVDPGQMVQVMLNLAANARDAMAAGGTLTIEVQVVELDAAYCAQRLDVAPGPYCLLAITDTGMGIAADDLPRVFEPFFTTKGERHGTGLGLASCHGIVKQHGGHIAIYSEVGSGTTVKAYLPRVDECSAMSGDPQQHSDHLPRAQGSATILLCEDDQTIRRMVTTVLRDAGYQLLAANDGEEALAVAANHQGAIDLLLTDVVMPRLSGAQLAERLLVTNPQLRVLFISGYTENVVVRHGVLKPGVRLLQKPFTIEGLLARVGEELARPPSVD